MGKRLMPRAIASGVQESGSHKAGATLHFARTRNPGTILPCVGREKTVGAEAFWSGFRLVAVF
jgi:hypothetical protein